MANQFFAIKAKSDNISEQLIPYNQIKSENISEQSTLYNQSKIRQY